MLAKCYMAVVSLVFGVLFPASTGAAQPSTADQVSTWDSAQA